MWWRDDAVSDRLTEYAGRLPAAATREPLTGQQQLDAWARDHTLGLIDRFPVQVSPELLLVLGRRWPRRSVGWSPSTSFPPRSSPLLEHGEDFGTSVSRALRSVRGHDVRLVRTEAAGLVGAHVAASGDGLAVVSVLGAPDVAREAVLAAAYEVALGLAGARVGEHVSLFDVPSGRSDLGEVVEDTVTARGAVVRVEDGVAVLRRGAASTSWTCSRAPTAAGFRGAARLLARPPPTGRLDARQVAVATLHPGGFRGGCCDRDGHPSRVRRRPERGAAAHADAEVPPAVRRDRCRCRSAGTGRLRSGVVGPAGLRRLDRRAQ